MFAKVPQYGPKVLLERYFATGEPKEAIEKIWGRFEEIAATQHPMASKWLAADMHYYGDWAPNGLTYAVTRGGPEGELAQVRVNNSRALVKAKIALVTASQVMWAVRSKSDSTAASFATTLGRSLLEDSWKRGGIAEADVRWEEMTEVYTESYAFLEWDRTRGPDAAVDAETAMRVHSGDVRLNLLPPWLVRSDDNRSSAEDQDWWYVRLDRPKADLAALCKCALLDGHMVDDEDRIAREVLDAKDERRLASSNVSSKDLCRVIHFIHRPTSLLPLGLHAVMLDGRICIRLTPLVGAGGDYKQVPLIRRAADARIDTPFGWSSYLDILGPQQILDSWHTTQATILTTFGNPVLMYEDGSKIEPGDVASFGRPLVLPPNAKPAQYLAPASLDESHMKYAESVENSQQKIMSLNDAALGQPQTAERNAQAEALFASMAVQQAGPAVLARRQTLSQLGKLWLTTLGKNVTDEREAKIVGAGESNVMADAKQWTGSSLGPIDDVEVEETSPLEATPQGRWAIFETYMQMGALKTPEEAEQVRNTGRLNRVVDPVRDEQLLIQAEYEMLMRAEVPIVHPTQNQPLHYAANASVLMSVSALKKPQVIQAVQQTLDMRYQFFFGVPAATDPLRLDRQRYLMGQGPLPAPMGMGGTPPPQPGQQSGTPQPAPGPSNSTGQPPGPPQPMPSPDASSSPIGGPKNPVTGSPYSPTAAPIQ